MDLKPYGQHRHHLQHTVNLSLNVALILISEPDPYCKHCAIMPVHTNEHLTLTLAPAIALDPSIILFSDLPSLYTETKILYSPSY